jgi:hypothetical protein
LGTQRSASAKGGKSSGNSLVRTNTNVTNGAQRRLANANIANGNIANGNSAANVSDVAKPGNVNVSNIGNVSNVGNGGIQVNANGNARNIGQDIGQGIANNATAHDIGQASAQNLANQATVSTVANTASSVSSGVATTALPRASAITLKGS